MFAHNALSARLLDPSIRNIIAFSGQELSTWLTQQSETLRLQTSKGDKAPHAALNVAAPAYSDAFDFFHNEKEANERYHAYLEGRTKTGRWSEDTFVGGWEWGDIGRGTVVDVSSDSPLWPGFETDHFKGSRVLTPVSSAAVLSAIRAPH